MEAVNELLRRLKPLAFRIWAVEAYVFAAILFAGVVVSESSPPGVRFLLIILAGSMVILAEWLLARLQ